MVWQLKFDLLKRVLPEMTCDTMSSTAVLSVWEECMPEYIVCNHVLNISQECFI